MVLSRTTVHLIYFYLQFISSLKLFPVEWNFATSRCQVAKHWTIAWYYCMLIGLSFNALYMWISLILVAMDRLESELVDTEIHLTLVIVSTVATLMHWHFVFFK